MQCVTPLSATGIPTLTDRQHVHPSRRARLRAHGLLLSHQGFAMRRIAAATGARARKTGVSIGHFVTRASKAGASVF